MKRTLVKNEKVIYADSPNVGFWSFWGFIVIAFLLLPLFGIGLIVWLVLHELKDSVVKTVLTAIATIIVAASGALIDVPWLLWPVVPILCYFVIDICLRLSRKYIEWAEKVSWQERFMKDRDR